FLIVDVAFFGANVVKISDGGWFPLGVAAIVYTLMTTWKKGRDFLAAFSRENSLPMALFLDDVRQRKPTRVPGTAVFMCSDPSGAPPVLLHHLKHNKMLHDRVILVSLINEEIPQVPDLERVTYSELGEGIAQVVARYGFMETPNVPELLHALKLRMGAHPALLAPAAVKPLDTTFYLGRETLLADGPSRMAHWRKRLFIVMARNAVSASTFFALPPNRVVEMGAQIQL
ncbi:MAG: KUP/HAK/KT family potassium transporter, partial [Gemmatimonadales bacterium]